MDEAGSPLLPLRPPVRATLSLNNVLHVVQVEMPGRLARQTLVPAAAAAHVNVGGRGEEGEVAEDVDVPVSSPPGVDQLRQPQWMGVAN